MKARSTVVLVLLCLLPAGAALSYGADLPDLAQLKIAAESGNPIAQFEYAGRIAITNATERINWIQRSAEQGYAPAQDSMAEYCVKKPAFDPKSRRALDREAARWASCAAYQGFAGAQCRLSDYYDRGAGLAKDPVAAYMWLEIAVRTVSGDRNPTMGLLYKAYRDALIARTTTENIAEGQRRAAEFKPMKFAQINPVEADLVFADLKLSAIYNVKGYTSIVVNNVRFLVGETKAVRLSDQTSELTCLAIEGRQAQFQIKDTPYRTTLTLK
jgi:TPR repeat protein